MSTFFSRVYFSRYFYSIVSFRHHLRRKDSDGFYYFSDLYHQNRLTNSKPLVARDKFNSFYTTVIKSSPSRHFFFPIFFLNQSARFDYSFTKFQTLLGFGQKFLTVFFRFSICKFIFINKLSFIPFFYTIKK